MTTTKWSDLRKQADDATRPLPADWYDLVVKKSEFKVASTGSPMIVLQLLVEEGPQAGKTAFTNLVFSPDNSFALSIFFRNLGAFGIGDEFFGALERNDVDPEVGMPIIAAALEGRFVRAELGIRAWQGQERNEVKQFSPGKPNPPAIPNLSLAGAGGNGAPSGPPVPPTGPPVPPASAPSAPAVPTPGTSPGFSSGAPGGPPPIPTF